MFAWEKYEFMTKLVQNLDMLRDLQFGMEVVS